MHDSISLETTLCSNIEEDKRSYEPLGQFLGLQIKNESQLMALHSVYTSQGGV